VISPPLLHPSNRVVSTLFLFLKFFRSLMNTIVLIGIFPCSSSFFCQYPQSRLSMLGGPGFSLVFEVRVRRLSSLKTPSPKKRNPFFHRMSWRPSFVKKGVFSSSFRFMVFFPLATFPCRPDRSRPLYYTTRFLSFGSRTH